MLLLYGHYLFLRSGFFLLLSYLALNVTLRLWLAWFISLLLMNLSFPTLFLHWRITLSTFTRIFPLFCLVAIDDTHFASTIRFHVLLRPLPSLFPLCLLLLLYLFSPFLLFAEELFTLLLFLLFDPLKVILPLLPPLVEELPLDLLTTLLLDEHSLLQFFVILQHS